MHGDFGFLSAKWISVKTQNKCYTASSTSKPNSSHSLLRFFFNSCSLPAAGNPLSIPTSPCFYEGTSSPTNPPTIYSHQTQTLLWMSVESYLYSLLSSCLFHGSCSTMCLVGMSQQMSLLQLLWVQESGKKEQNTIRRFFLVLFCLVLSCLVLSCLVLSCLVLFFGVFISVSTKGAQLCNVRQTNTGVFSVKSLLPCVLLSVCFSRTSFYLCLF
jgi:hypothetical protein